MSDDDEDDVWLRSKSALALVVARTGNVEEAESLLATWATNHDFACRCSSHVTELDFGPLSNQAPTETSDRVLSVERSRPDAFIFIGKAFWKTTATSIHEDRLWQWDKGVFASVDRVPPVLRRDPRTARNSITPARRYVAYDVEFQRQAIIELLQTLPKPLSLKARRVVSTAKFPDQHVLQELESWIASGEMEEQFGGVDQHGAQARIEKHLKAKLSSYDHGQWKEPSESTARRRACLIMALWKTARSA